jgi:hypothetical protein
MTLEGIAENIISDFLFVLIPLLFGWMFLVFTHRVQLLKFFGVYNSRRIVIYLSNLIISPGSASGVNNKQWGYHGPAVPFYELPVANHLQGLFNYLLPSFSDGSSILRKLLISDVQVQLMPSPHEQGQPEQLTSFITLGSPMYNTISCFVESGLHSKVQFQEDARAILVEAVPPITDTSYGFIERIVDRERKRSIFYAAGLAKLGTAGAAHFLATEWKRLNRKYGDNTNFVVMLRFDTEDDRRWSIVFEQAFEK